MQHTSCLHNFRENLFTPTHSILDIPTGRSGNEKALISPHFWYNLMSFYFGVLKFSRGQTKLFKEEDLLIVN